MLYEVITTQIVQAVEGANGFTFPDNEFVAFAAAVIANAVFIAAQGDDFIFHEGGVEAAVPFEIAFFYGQGVDHKFPTGVLHFANIFESASATHIAGYRHVQQQVVSILLKVVGGERKAVVQYSYNFV